MHNAGRIDSHKEAQEMRGSKTFVCFAMTLAISAAVAAQAPQAPQGATASSQDRNANTTVTLIGCVEASAPTTYVLSVSEQPATNTAANRPAGEAAGQATVGTTGATLVGQKIQLNATDEAGLKTHVGHKVEIRGALSPNAAAPAAGSARPTGGAPAMRLAVNNVRMLEMTCSPAGASAAPGTAAPAPRPSAPAQPQQPQPEQPRQER
jgi:hypothetical protein